MKSVLIALGILGVFTLIPIVSVAGEEKSAFTADYLAQVENRKEREPAAETFEDREKLRQEHEKYLRQLTRTDRHMAN